MRIAVAHGAAHGVESRRFVQESRVGVGVPATPGRDAWARRLPAKRGSVMPSKDARVTKFTVRLWATIDRGRILETNVAALHLGGSEAGRLASSILRSATDLAAPAYQGAVHFNVEVEANEETPHAELYGLARQRLGDILTALCALPKAGEAR